MLQFIRKVIDAIGQAHGKDLISEPDVPQNLKFLYCETHFTLCEILLYLLDKKDEGRLQNAKNRFERWLQQEPSKIHFNAFAPALSLYLLNQYGLGKVPLAMALEDFCKAQKQEYSKVLRLQCGNNMYILQLATDTILRPLALKQKPQEKEVTYLIEELEKYQSKEGFFYDWPRLPSKEEDRIFPLTYCLKILFIIGICEHLYPTPRLRSIFQVAMKSILPLLTKEGSFYYFGRTDNTTFSIGLGIFNLRSLATFSPELRDQCLLYAALQEDFFKSTPRSPEGWLQVNQMEDLGEPKDLILSRDDYAYPTQYTIAGCCYILCAWLFNKNLYPQQTETISPKPGTFFSNDLGIAKIQSNQGEAIVRIASQPQANDRRYFGPTILRFTMNDSLLIGAIPVTVSSDYPLVQKNFTQPWKLIELLAYRYHRGFENQDAISTGFLPSLKLKNGWLIPKSAKTINLENDTIFSEHEWQLIETSGFPGVWNQLTTLFKKNCFKSQSGAQPTPKINNILDLNLSRRIILKNTTLHLEDNIQGKLPGNKLFFWVRHTPKANIIVTGLNFLETRKGWTSDGIAQLALYSLDSRETEIHYCISVSPH